MNFLEQFEWLIEECHEHNREYDHHTDIARLSCCEKLLRELNGLKNEQNTEVKTDGVQS